MMSRHTTPSHTMRLGRAGFTMIEVLIAVTILAGITALTGMAINTIFRSREHWEGRSERAQLVRNAMRRITNDLSSAYIAGPQHGGEEIPGEERDPTTISEEELRRMQLNPPVQFGFIGKQRELHFTSFGHRRTQPDEQSSFHAEIGYALRRGRDPDTNASVQQLIRRHDTSLDDRITRGGTLNVLLPDVQDIEFEYWDPGTSRVGDLREVSQGRWVKDWDTTRREHGGRLPTRVRITLTMPPITEDDDAEIYTTQVQLNVTEVLEF